MDKFQDIITKIEGMTVVELAELVKAIEAKFGVSAAMPVAAGGAAGGAEGGEEKTAFDLHLASGGDQKIQLIKVFREALGLGLKEAKDLVDSAPKLVKAGMKKEEAEDLKKKIEAAGGKVEIK